MNLKVLSYAVVLVAVLSIGTAQTDSTLYADGGYQDSLVPCIAGEWKYKEKLSDGSNLETILRGCVSVDQFQPYPYFVNDAEEIANLIEPQDSRTDKAMWCPVIRDVYNPTPLKVDANKFNWGYCMELSLDTITSVPTSLPTSFPTKSPVPDPTLLPVDTQAPTTKDTTPSPTTAATEAVAPSPGDVGSQVEERRVSMGEWTFLGIGVASTLVLVAFLLTAFVLTQVKRQEQVLLDDEAVNEADLEENTSMARS